MTDPSPAAAPTADPDLVLEVDRRYLVSELNAVQEGLRRYNERFLGESPGRISIYLRRLPGREIVGGAFGFMVGREVFVNWVWVDDAARGRGHGSRLLTRLEGEAAAAGLTRVTLSTFAFGAAAFYERHGYRAIGTIPDCIAGFDKTYYRKDLVRP